MSCRCRRGAGGGGGGGRVLYDFRRPYKIRAYAVDGFNGHTKFGRLKWYTNGFTRGGGESERLASWWWLGVIVVFVLRA